MEQLNPKKIKIIQGLPPKTDKDARIALDTEWFGMDVDRMHRPHGTFASLACTMDAKTVYIITDPEQIPEFLSNVSLGVHIWHNAKFDIVQLRRIADYPERLRIWDTMLVEQELFSGYYSDFSLQAVVRRWLDIYLEKDSRSEFEDASEMTPEMLEYSALDVVATWMVFKAQKSYMNEDDIKIWTDIDRGALWAVINMDGMIIDQERWRALAKEQEKSAQAVEAKYPDINLRSPKQVLAHLHKLKFKSIKSTGEKILEKIPNCQFATDVLKYRKHAKAASTYGESFLEVVEADGRAYSDFKVNGAATGRFSSKNPNLENIPKDAKYRHCFVAAPGHVFVDADWSSQEPRCAAYLSQDRKLIQIFKDKKDIYIESAREMFGWDLTRTDPRRNKRMKPTVLGACYGLTEFGMEIQYGIPREEGKELLEAFFSTFTGLRDWIEEQQTGKEYVTTILGRKYWLNPYQDKSNRNAINSPVQGSAGDALKIAAYRFTNLIKNSSAYIRIVNLIHDEILVECDEDIKEDVSDMLRDTMISVAEEMHPGIPADVEIGFGCTWGEAHV